MLFHFNVFVEQTKCMRVDVSAWILYLRNYSENVNDFFQMKPTRCTILLSIFISTSVHVSGNYVPIIRRTYYIYATLVFFTLYGWLPGLQTRQPPILTHSMVQSPS